MRSRSRMRYLVMRESAIGVWFLRGEMEGWMGRRPFYMLRSGVSKIKIRRLW